MPGLSLGLGLGLSARNKGGGAAAYASGPPPAGYRWDFVTFQGARVTHIGVPVVALVGA